MRLPWDRETRPGLFGRNRMSRKERNRGGMIDTYLGSYDGFVQPSKPPNDDGIHPLEAPIELMATANYERLGKQNCIGGGGVGAARVNPNWQIVAEISGCLIPGFSEYESGDSLTYMTGPRYSPRASRKFSPFGQVLLGGRKITHEILNPTLRKLLLNQWNEGTVSHYPQRSAYSIERQATGFELAAGGVMSA
jgi:hypothetical protein